MFCSCLLYTSENYPSKLKAEEAIYKALHHQLVASALATKLARQINPQFQIGCMVTKTMTYPETCNPKDIYLAQKDNRMNSLYTDVQVRGEYPVSYTHLCVYNWMKSGSVMIA